MSLTSLTSFFYPTEEHFLEQSSAKFLVQATNEVGLKEYKSNR